MILAVACLGTAAGAAALLIRRPAVQTASRPQPGETIIVREGEQNYRKREEWIALMHRAAPGVDWQAQDEATRVHVSQEMETAPAVRWRELGSRNLAGRMHRTAYDAARKLVYSASCGGTIWRGPLNGTAWVPLNEKFKLDLNSLHLISNGGTKRILVCAVRAYYYSENEGATWVKASGLDDRGALKKSVVVGGAEPGIYLLAQEWNYSTWNRQITLYRSTDRGASFAPLARYGEPQYGPPGRFDLWAAGEGSSNAYFAANGEIFRLAGAAVTKVGSIPLSASGTTYLTGAPSDDLTLYVLDAHDDKSDIFHSTDGGATWTRRGTIPETPFYPSSFACSAVNPASVYFGGVNGYRSTNRGATWIKVSDWGEYYKNMAHKLHADICGFCSIPGTGGETLLIATDGGLFVSTDGFKTVSNISLKGLRVSQYYGTYTSRRDGQALYAGSQDQGFQTSSPPRTSLADFTQVISGDYGHLVSGDATEGPGDNVWSVYPGFAMLSTSGTLPRSNFVCSGQLWMPPLMPDPASPQNAYLGGGGPGSGAYLYQLNYRSGAIGYKKLSYNFGSGDNGAISALAASPLKSVYRYVTTSTGKFFASLNGGGTWRPTASFDGPDAHYFYGSSILPSKVHLGTVYLAGSGYSNPPVYKSTNHGQTFAPFNTGLPSTLVYGLAATETEDLLFAATEVGPYLYQASTGRWTLISGGKAPDQTYWSVEYLPNLRTARFGTYGRGIWDCDVSALTKDPTLTVLSPKGGEKWAVGSARSVSWKTTGLMKTVRVSFSVDGGKTWRILSRAVKNTGVYAWKIPNSISGSCLVRVGEAVDGLPFDASDRTFSIVR